MVFLFVFVYHPKNGFWSIIVAPKHHWGKRTFESHLIHTWGHQIHVMTNKSVFIVLCHIPRHLKPPRFQQPWRLNCENKKNYNHLSSLWQKYYSCPIVFNAIWKPKPRQWLAMYQELPGIGLWFHSGQDILSSTKGIIIHVENEVVYHDQSCKAKATVVMRCIISLTGWSAVYRTGYEPK